MDAYLDALPPSSQAPTTAHFSVAPVDLVEWQASQSGSATLQALLVDVSPVRLPQKPSLRISPCFSGASSSASSSSWPTRPSASRSASTSAATSTGASAPLRSRRPTRIRSASSLPPPRAPQSHDTSYLTPESPDAVAKSEFLDLLRGVSQQVDQNAIRKKKHMDRTKELDKGPVPPHQTAADRERARRRERGASVDAAPPPAKRTREHANPAAGPPPDGNSFAMDVDPMPPPVAAFPSFFTSTPRVNGPGGSAPQPLIPQRAPILRTSSLPGAGTGIQARVPPTSASHSGSAGPNTQTRAPSSAATNTVGPIPATVAPSGPASCPTSASVAGPSRPVIAPSRPTVPASGPPRSALPSKQHPLAQSNSRQPALPQQAQPPAQSHHPPSNATIATRAPGLSQRRPALGMSARRPMQGVPSGPPAGSQPTANGRPRPFKPPLARPQSALRPPPALVISKPPPAPALVKPLPGPQGQGWSRTAGHGPPTASLPTPDSTPPARPGDGAKDSGAMDVDAGAEMEADSSYGDISFDADALEEEMRKYD